jgi:hypothetical protein
LLCASKINAEAARFLVLAMNQEQDAFEYEFLPIDTGDEFLIPFCSDSALDHAAVRNDVIPFLSRFDAYLRGQAAYFGLQEGPPDYFVLISTATFTNNYYSLREGRLGIIALGNWKRFMAPPSLLEFVLTLLIRESVGAMSQSLRAPVHLGTKGCLFDFTPSLQDVRGKVFNGFICAHCRAALAAEGLSDLTLQLERLLRRKWLGRPTDPETPAGIAFHLGYDLFVTKGLRATPWESVKSTARHEGTKQLATVLGAALIAMLLLILGLR